MNSTVNHMWFIPLVLSNIVSRAHVVIFSFMFTIPHEHQYTSGFSKNRFLLDSYQDLRDYLMSFYKAHFVPVMKASILKNHKSVVESSCKIHIVQKHMCVMVSDKNVLQLL